MSQIVNHDKAKDKKKTLVERFVQFASQTMRINRKSDSKKKHKKSGSKDPYNDFRDRNDISMKPLETEIQTCTFCDYCDREIVAQFTGQNIIYHDACQQSHQEDFPMEPNVDIEGPTEILSSIKSDNLLLTNELRADSQPYPGSRLSTSLNDLTNSLMLTARDHRERSLDICTRNNVLLDNDTGSYTFSTTDLSTIKQYGILIKNVTSVEGDVPLAGRTLGRAEAAMADDAAQRHSIGSINYAALPPEDLASIIDVFNNNDQGLSVERVGDQIMGKVRVFINLLRPIKMLLTARPPSLFDVLPDATGAHNQSTIDRAYYNKEVIFRLPRGTTKLIYISITCPTTDVISVLLSKFNIRNNPKKFSLYEHTIKSAKEVEVCKLRLGQFPLKIMMDWCSGGVDHYDHCLQTKKFVLQENDPGSIEWEEFSVPELRSFLTILDQEELEKRRQIECKYGILRSDIGRRLAIKRKLVQ